MFYTIFNLIILAPPPPGFYPQGAPYPKADGGYPTGGSYPTGGGYTTGGSYPSGGGYPPPYGQQNAPFYGGSNVPPQNDSFNAQDNFGFSDKTIRKNFIAYAYIPSCSIIILN